MTGLIAAGKRVLSRKDGVVLFWSMFRAMFQTASVRNFPAMIFRGQPGCGHMVCIVSILSSWNVESSHEGMKRETFKPLISAFISSIDYLVETLPRSESIDSQPLRSPKGIQSARWDS